MQEKKIEVHSDLTEHLCHCEEKGGGERKKKQRKRKTTRKLDMI